MFKYLKYDIKEDMFNKNKDLRLENTYGICVNELGLQQTKRDQTIAFYITIISLAISTIIKMKPIAQFASFFILFILGCLLIKVIMRYREYKEVYWITCRTIIQLYNFKQENINKELVQHIFYKTMEKNVSTVLIFKDKINKTISSWKSYKKMLNSAETTLYLVLVIISSLALWISIFIIQGFLWDNNYVKVILATIITLINYTYWNIYYYKRLKRVYNVIFDNSDSSFNSTFSKAWFLHSFY